MDIVDKLLESKQSFSLQSGNNFMNFCEILLFLARFSKINNCRISEKITSIMSYSQLTQKQVSIVWDGGPSFNFNKSLSDTINYIISIKETTKVNYIVLPLTIKQKKSKLGHANQLLIYFDRKYNKTCIFHIEPHGQISNYINEIFDYQTYVKYLEKHFSKIGFFATTSKIKQDNRIQGTENIGSIFEILRYDKVDGYCTTWSYIITENIIKFIENGLFQKEMKNTNNSRVFQEFILELLVAEILFGVSGLKLYDINIDRDDYIYLLYGKYRLLSQNGNKSSKKKKLETIENKLEKVKTEVNGYRINELLLYYHQMIIKFSNLVFFGILEIIDNRIDSMPLYLKRQYGQINLKSNTNKLIDFFLGESNTKIKNINIDTRRVTGIINRISSNIDNYYKIFLLKTNTQTIKYYLNLLSKQLPKEYDKNTIVLYGYDNIVKKVKKDDNSYYILSDDVSLDKCRIIDKLPNNSYLLYNIEFDENILVENINNSYINIIPNKGYYVDLYSKIKTLLQENYRYYKDISNTSFDSQFFNISKDVKIISFLFSCMTYFTKTAAKKKRLTLLKQQTYMGKYALKYIPNKTSAFIVTFSDDKNYTHFCPEIMKIVNKWREYECF